MKVTVKEKTENEIDWNKPQLVISSHGECIVQTSIDQSESAECHFSGQKLSNGGFSTNWRKKAFKKFTGTITIEQ
jgi:hypothetical protein